MSGNEMRSHEVLVFRCDALEEEVQRLREELQQSEKIAEEGYKQAYDIIKDLHTRLALEEEINRLREELEQSTKVAAGTEILTYKQAYDIIKDLHTRLEDGPQEFVYDWEKALGDTIKEKTEGLSVFLIETVFKTVGEPAFIVCSPEFACVWETACCPYDYLGCGEKIDPQEIWPMIAGRFRLFKTNNLPAPIAYIFGKNRVGIVKMVNFAV